MWGYGQTKEFKHHNVNNRTVYRYQIFRGNKLMIKNYHAKTLARGHFDSCPRGPSIKV